MDRNIVEEYPAGGLLMPPTHQGPSFDGVDHDGHPVQLVVPGVEDVPAHPQWLSKALIRSAAI